MKELDKVTPLRKMRDASNDGKGMSQQEAADGLKAILGEESRTGESIVMLEKRGCNDVRILRGLAALYGCSFEEVEKAASRS